MLQSELKILMLEGSAREAGLECHQIMRAASAPGAPNSGSEGSKMMMRTSSIARSRVRLACSLAAFRSRSRGKREEGFDYRARCDV